MNQALKRVAFVGLSCMVLAGLLFVVRIGLRWNAPPLHIGHDGSTVNVNVSTLGEYPTTITRIRLSDLKRGTVLWEIEAKGGDATQLHGFRLHKGDNPIQPRADFGGYEVLTPTQSGTFTLTSDSKYKVEVWGGRGVLAKNSAVFQVSNAQ